MGVATVGRDVARVPIRTECRSRHRGGDVAAYQSGPSVGAVTAPGATMTAGARCALMTDRDPVPCVVTNAKAIATITAPAMRANQRPACLPSRSPPVD